MIAAARCLSCLLVLSATAARAESAVVLPLRSERALSTEERGQLAAALDQALRARGVQGVPTSAPAPCADADCITAAIREHGASYAVELTVWRGADGAITGISVSVVQPAGERYSEGVQVGSAQGIPSAVERAADGAYQRMRRGPGPWLQLDGTPVGAAISVDGQASGVLPRQVKVSGGLHRVSVTHPGYEPFDATVTVPRNPDGLKHVAVVLAPVRSAATQDTTAASSRTSPLNYAIGGAAAVAAALLAIRPVRSAIEDGECGRIEGGRCTGVVTFDAVQAIQLGAAGLLLAGGVTMVLWAPIRDTPGESMSSIVLSGQF